MLANTAKYAGAPKRCMTNSEETGPEKFLSVGNYEETGRALVARSDEQRDKGEASGSCMVKEILRYFDW